MKNPFKVNDNLTSYAYTLTKIFTCFTLWILAINRSRWIVISYKPLNIILKAVFIILSLLAVYVFYICVAELYSTWENRDAKKHSKNYSIEKCKKLNKEQLLKYLNDNDIIEFEIIKDEGTTKIGTSSDSKHGSSVFFDKSYYISDKEFKEVEQFSKALDSYCSNGVFFVATMDGVDIETQNA